MSCVHPAKLSLAALLLVSSAGCLGINNPYAYPYGGGPYGTPQYYGTPQGYPSGVYGTPYQQPGIQTLTPGPSYVPGTVVPGTTNPGTFQGGGGLQPIPQPNTTYDGKEVTVPQPYMQRPTGMLEPQQSYSVSPIASANYQEPGHLTQPTDLRPINQRQPAAATTSGDQFFTPQPSQGDAQPFGSSPFGAPATSNPPAADNDPFLAPRQVAQPEGGGAFPFAPAAPVQNEPAQTLDIFGQP